MLPRGTRPAKSLLLPVTEGQRGLREREDVAPPGVACREGSWPRRRSAELEVLGPEHAVGGNAERLPKQPGRHLVSHDTDGFPPAGIERGVEAPKLGPEPRLPSFDRTHSRPRVVGNSHQSYYFALAFALQRTVGAGGFGTGRAFVTARIGDRLLRMSQ